MKYAFITGITGQDGSYLSELLLEKKYKVYGLIRRCSNFNTQRIEHIYKKLHLRYGDMTDILSIINVLNEIKKENPSRIEFYNLAAQSHVQVSFKMPIYTSQVDAIGTLNCLEAIKQCQLEKITRFYQASTSELYGKVKQIPQTEKTPFNPQSPYAVSKLYSYWIVKNYREAYNIFACNGILFNHLSPRRGKTFVTRKITTGIANIINGKQEFIELGNIYSKRDWGWAPDYCLGMYLMMQSDNPDDYVLATGKAYSVKDFIEEAFNVVNIKIRWKGNGLNEIGYDEKTKKTLIKINEKYYRPSEVDFLLGDASKARKKLNWVPKVTFKEFIKIMVNYDLKHK